MAAHLREFHRSAHGDYRVDHLVQRSAPASSPRLPESKTIPTTAATSGLSGLTDRGALQAALPAASTRFIGCCSPLAPRCKNRDGAWLLVRRSIAEPTDLTAYVVFASGGTALTTLVTVAGTRWTVESDFEATKGEVGLDHYEVRSWVGWYETSRSPCGPMRSSCGFWQRRWMPNCQKKGGSARQVAAV